MLSFFLSFSLFFLSPNDTRPVCYLYKINWLLIYSSLHDNDPRVIFLYCWDQTNMLVCMLIEMCRKCRSTLLPYLATASTLFKATRACIKVAVSSLSLSLSLSLSVSVSVSLSLFRFMFSLNLKHDSVSTLTRFYKPITCQSDL